MFAVFKKYLIFVISITTKTKNMNTQTVTINTEMKRRTDLIEDKAFRVMCIETAQKLGISASEWNKNIDIYLMFFANEMCRIENEK